MFNKFTLHFCSKVEDKSKLDSALMSPVSVAPVQAVDLDLEIPKIVYPKEFANEDPAANSDEDWTKLNDCEEEEIVTKKYAFR